MDISGSLSDILSKSPSPLNGVLSPSAADTDETEGADSLFSALVSEAAALAENPETGEALAPPPVADKTAGLASNADASFSEASLPGDNGLLALLREILSILRSSPETSGDDAQTEIVAEETSSEEEDVSDADLSDQASDALSDVLDSLSSIVEDLAVAAKSLADSNATLSDKKSASETLLSLLAVMQLVVQALQKNPLTESGTGGFSADAAPAAPEALSAIPTWTAPNPADLFDAAAAEESLPPADEAFSSGLSELLDEAEIAAQNLREDFALAYSSSAGDDEIVAATVETTGDTADSVKNLGQILAQLAKNIEDSSEILKPAPKFSKVDLNPAPAVSETGNEDVGEALLSQTGGTAEVETDVAVPATPHPATIAKKAEQAPATVATAADKPSSAKTAPATTTDAPPPPQENKTSGDTPLAVAPSEKQDSPKNGGDKLLSGQRDASTLSKFFVPSESDATTASLNNAAESKNDLDFSNVLSASRSARTTSKARSAAVEQAVLFLSRNAKNGVSQMSLQLEPLDLGKISVKLDFSSDGNVQASVVADNPKTLEMLQKDSRSLVRALQDAGLRAEPGCLDFSLGGQDGRDASAQTFDGHDAPLNDNGDGASSGSADANDGTEIADLDIVPETYYITPGGVNIRV